MSKWVIRGKCIRDLANASGACVEVLNYAGIIRELHVHDSYDKLQEVVLVTKKGRNHLNGGVSGFDCAVLPADAATTVLEKARAVVNALQQESK